MGRSENNAVGGSSAYGNSACWVEQLLGVVSWGWVRLCLPLGTVHGGNCLNVFDILMEDFMSTGINGFFNMAV